MNDYEIDVEKEKILHILFQESRVIVPGSKLISWWYIEWNEQKKYFRLNGRCRKLRKKGEKRRKVSLRRVKPVTSHCKRLEIVAVHFQDPCPNLASAVVLWDNCTPICIPLPTKGTPLSQLGYRLNSGKFLYSGNSIEKTLTKFSLMNPECVRKKQKNDQFLQPFHHCRITKFQHHGPMLVLSIPPLALLGLLALSASRLPIHIQLQSVNCTDITKLMNQNKIK